MYIFNRLNAPPSNFCIEALTSNVLKFGGENFGRELDLDEITRVGPP